MMSVMSSHKISDMIRENVVSEFVSSIHRATTSDIITDLQNAGLDKDKVNSYPQRTWDLINRNISRINLPQVVNGYSKRGAWNIITACDKENGIVYSFMRESRFKVLSRNTPEHVHYIQGLADSFNHDDFDGQMSFFSSKELDQFEVHRVVNQILEDLNIPDSIVKGHILILFSSRDEILHSIRACIINGALEICDSHDLSYLIKLDESIVIEEVSVPEAKENNPSRNLSLTAKGKKRKKINAEVALREEQKSEEQSS